MLPIGGTMGILDGIKTKVNEFDKAYNPARKVADAISAATPPPTEAQTARQEAVARGQAARQEAVTGGQGELKVQNVPTDLKVKPFE
jgi:hypothetical protein